MLTRLANMIKLGFIAAAGFDRDRLPSQLVGYHGKSGAAVPIYPYGFHAVADEGNYALIISLGANGEERICIPTSMLSRPLGDSGDVFLYHPKTGTNIKLDASGNVLVTAVGEVNVTSPTLVKITSPEVEIVGNLDVSGSVGIGVDLDVIGDATVTGATTLGTTVTSNGVNISDDHQHTYTVSGTPNETSGAH